MNGKLKATGMLRPIDKNGRVVIPIEIRKTLNLKTNDPMEIFISDDTLVLKKYSPFCVFCGSSDDLVSIGEKRVCAECVRKLNSQI